MDRTVYIKTTESCNLNCKHCFTRGNRPARKFLDVEKTIDWIRRYTKAIDPNDHVHFEFHGGEPFLAPLETLKAITKAIREDGPKNQSIGATTNLVYKLKQDLLNFIVDDLDSIATSWDKGIRFENPGQEFLWFSNMQKIRERGKEVTLNVSLSRAVLEMKTTDLLLLLKGTGCYKVLFDRITVDGNAKEHLDMFPNNAEINQWYLRLHEASELLGARKWFYNAALEDVYAKFEQGNSSCGTFCRDCEERLLTINANGTIGGCPNTAWAEPYGKISMEIEDLFKSSKRIDVIVKEKTRNEACFTCPVFNYCGSDCHQLAWEGDVCASPKQLMMKMAGLEVELSPMKSKRFIPIKSA